MDPGVRRRALTVAGLLAAVVLAWVNGLLVRTVTVHVRFAGDAASLGDYRVAAGAGVTTALLLVLALPALVRLGAPAWLAYLAGFGVATQLALGVTAWWASRPQDDTEVLDRSAWTGAKDTLLLPGSWPLLVVLVVAVVVAVRGRSSRTPRSPRVP